MRAAALSRARRVFSRSADRAALPRSPPCPRSLSVRADACDDDAQRVVGYRPPPPPPPPRALELHRRTDIDGARWRPTIPSPQNTTRSRARVHQATHGPWPGRSVGVRREEQVACRADFVARRSQRRARGASLAPRSLTRRALLLPTCLCMY